MPSIYDHPHQPLNLSSDFQSRFGEAATKNHPLDYKAFILSEHGGVKLRFQWETMLHCAKDISKHEDVFSWIAMMSDSQAIHLSLLECAFYESLSQTNTSLRVSKAMNSISLQDDTQSQTLYAYTFFKNYDQRYVASALKKMVDTSKSIKLPFELTVIDSHLAKSLSTVLTDFDTANSTKRDLLATFIEAVEISEDLNTPKLLQHKHRI